MQFVSLARVLNVCMKIIQKSIKSFLGKNKKCEIISYISYIMSDFKVRFFAFVKYVYSLFLNTINLFVQDFNTYLCSIL